MGGTIIGGHLPPCPNILSYPTYTAHIRIPREQLLINIIFTQLLSWLTDEKDKTMYLVLFGHNLELLHIFIIFLQNNTPSNNAA